MDALQIEIDRNYDAFQRVVNQYLPDQRGQWALMRAGSVIGVYPTAVDAERAGVAEYGERPFSIQEITGEVVDLGFFSHVMH